MAWVVPFFPGKIKHDITGCTYYVGHLSEASNTCILQRFDWHLCQCRSYHDLVLQREKATWTASDETHKLNKPTQLCLTSFICFFSSSYCTVPWLSPGAALCLFLLHHYLACTEVSSLQKLYSNRPCVLSDFSCLLAAQWGIWEYTFY